MLRLLCDENINRAVPRGLKFRQSNVDLVRVQDVELSGKLDEYVLTWAAENNRIVLTHDRATFPGFAYDRIARGEPMPGVFVVDSLAPLGAIIEEIVMLSSCSEHSEWSGQVVYLPL